MTFISLVIYIFSFSTNLRLLCWQGPGGGGDGWAIIVGRGQGPAK
jgi:hypothetical protein